MLRCGAWLRFVAVISFVFALGLPGRSVEAAPMHTALTTIRSEATTIVIGTMSTSELVVDVDTVVRGKAALGPRRLKSSPDGHSFASGRVVVLLDRNDTFRWVGTLTAGASLETGVIHLSGFFDFNAHLVSPGMMTLAQLEGFLAKGTLGQKFAATITVADGTGAFVASGRGFTFGYDALTRKATIAGLGGACLGDAHVHGLDWGSLSVLLYGDCPRVPGKASGGGDRRLELEGKITGVDASGAITAEVSPTQPFLDVKDFATFMNDASIATVKRLLDVTLADGSKWTWDVGVGLVDPRGNAYPAGGLSSRSETNGDVTTHTETYDFRGPSIVLSPRSWGPVSTGGHAATLVTMIDDHTYGTCVFKEPGRPDRACTLGRGRSEIVKR